MATPLMPHATAAWLVDNTGLSFSQIAEFCGIHILEVQAMADDMTGSKYTGRDPVHAGELAMEEIEKGQADEDYVLKMSQGPDQVRRTKGPRYTPVSKRQDKPDGIAWLLRNHPEISKHPYHEGHVGIHAELDCLLKMDKEDLSYYKMLVLRIDRNESLTMSKPCSGCQSLLSQFNLKEIWYSDKNGNIIQM
jgi:deoxycytidylate deaminase